MEIELLTKDDMCALLKISMSKLDKQIDEGLPFIYVGETKRFEKETVIKWLKEKTEFKVKG